MNISKNFDSDFSVGTFIGRWNQKNHNFDRGEISVDGMIKWIPRQPCCSDCGREFTDEEVRERHRKSLGGIGYLLDENGYPLKEIKI